MSVVSGSGRPDIYKLESGKRVPSVTTITSRFKDSGGLIRWAWMQGIEGRKMEDTVELACDAGRLAHNLIENDIHEREQPALDLENERDVLASRCFDAYLSWRNGTRIEYTHTEIPLVSEKYAFGGTPDAIGTSASGRLMIVDWKTSGRIYHDHLVQCGAYALLWEEKTGEKVDEVHILRVGKEFANFTHAGVQRNLVELGISAFLKMRELFEIDKALKRAMG